MGDTLGTRRTKFVSELKICITKLQAKHKITDRETADILEGRAEMMKDASRASERSRRETARNAAIAADKVAEEAKQKPALPPGQRNGKR